MAKLNLKQVAIGYGAASLTSISTGLVGGYLWQHLGGQTDYVVIVGATWLITVGVPSVLISAESLRRILGQREGLSISASSRVLRRSIPLTVNGRASALFLSSVSWLKPSGLDDQAYQARGAPATAYLPDQFTVTVDGLPYTLQLPQIQDFLYTAWRRQRAGLPGLSRFYWTEERRPERFNRQLYDALMVLLSSVEGLIVDRGERRSGRLAAPPQLSIRAIQGVLGLG